MQKETAENPAVVLRINLTYPRSLAIIRLQGRQRLNGERVTHEWKAALAGALASAVVSFMASSIAAPSVASAEIRIVGDPGGEVTSYIRKFEAARASGEHIVIDGPCLSGVPC